MSGGHFDYQQYRISQIADEIKLLIETNGSEPNEWGRPVRHNYSPEVIDRFKEALVCLRKAFVYAQRIDWLVSGDDGEKSFLSRLNEELDEIEDANK